MKTERINIRVSSKEKAALEAAARARGLKVSAYLMMLVYADNPDLAKETNNPRTGKRHGGSPIEG